MNVSSIICEYPLPLDKSELDLESQDFEGIEWDELSFDTFCFLNEEEFQRSSYLISEDGFFYERTFNLELVRNKNDELVTKEFDAGLTKQDFTGEITFGTEIFGENHDYEIIFKTLFFKGDLKELELDHFSKRDNSKRREAAKKIQREVQLHQRKKRNPIYLFVSAFKFVVGSLIEIPKWILFKTFAVVLKLELWSKVR